MNKIESERPWLLVVSPSCQMLSALRRIDTEHRDREAAGKLLKEAMVHLAFSVQLCVRQARADRLFVIKCPVDTQPWQTTLMNRLYREAGVRRINLNISTTSDTTATHSRTPGPRVKPPYNHRLIPRDKQGVMTNSKLIAGELTKRRSSKECNEAYTVHSDACCEMMCRAAMLERNQGSSMVQCLRKIGAQQCQATDVTVEMGELMKSPHHDEELYDNYEFIDDVSGAKLDHKMAQAARCLEMDFFRRKGVSDEKRPQDSWNQVARHKQGRR